MTSLPAALAALATVTALGAVSVGSFTAAGGAPSSIGTATASAGPRRAVAVLTTGPRAGSPPGPVRGPAFSGTGPATPGAGPATSGAGPALGAESAPEPAAGPGDQPATGGFVLPLAVRAVVLRGFAPGPQPWSPGHRGVDLGAPAQAQVLAAGAGRVTFAGVIAGQGVVAIEHGTRLRTTYEPVIATVTVGQVVTAGQPIGTLQPAVTHGPSGPCLHWGARVGSGYLDPLLLLRDRHVPPVLLPVTGPPG